MPRRKPQPNAPPAPPPTGPFAVLAELGCQCLPHNAIKARRGWRQRPKAPGAQAAATPKAAS